MQDSRIDGLLDNVMMNAANVCGNLTTIRTSFDELKKEIEELKKCKENLLKELNKEATSKTIDLKNHQAREMALVDELAGKNDEIKKLKKEIEGRKKAFNDLREEMANRYIAIETHYDIYKTCENKIGELEKTRTCKNVEIGILKEENDNLKAQNERLKIEVKEALAKRDYYQDLANKEAADAKKAKWDCEKEMEWQKKKLQEFDYVLTKYRAKIKELEGRFELDEKSQLAILAGACAIRGHKHFDDGAYCNIAANGIIGWKHAEQVLMNMITKE